MSTRQMARMYSGGGYSPSGDGYGLLTKLLGKDSISGGPTINPDGSVNFNQFQGSSGLLGGTSRRQAAQLNQQLAMLGYEGDIEKKLQALMHSNNIALEGEKNKNIKEQKLQEAILKFAEKWNIPPDRIDQFKGDIDSIVNINLSNEKATKSDPAYLAAMQKGSQAELVAPAIRNANAQALAGTVPAGATQVTGRPLDPVTGEPRSNKDMMMIQGSSEEEQATTNALTGTVTNTKKAIPGKLRFPLDSEEKAALRTGPAGDLSVTSPLLNGISASPFTVNPNGSSNPPFVITPRGNSPAPAIAPTPPTNSVSLNANHNFGSWAPTMQGISTTPAVKGAPFYFGNNMAASMGLGNVNFGANIPNMLKGSALPQTSSVSPDVMQALDYNSRPTPEVSGYNPANFKSKYIDERGIGAISPLQLEQWLAEREARLRTLWSNSTNSPAASMAPNF